jgi:peptidyl-tRNA hydrolase, PTH1 family
MKIIACLGNPGRKYRSNRHNAGALIGARLAESLDIPIREKRFSSECGTGRIGQEPVLMLFPLTFMNNSGTSVREALSFYSVLPPGLLVIHDEIELPFGDCRMKFGGGHKGHNGLRSIIQHAGSADFHRMRFGVGRPGHPDREVADYVLSDFTAEEMRALDEMLPSLKDLVTACITGV